MVLNFMNISTAFLVATIACSVVSQPALSQTKKGNFRGEAGESVKGAATWKSNSIRFSSSFKASKGPDLYVYVGNGKPTKIVGKLKRQAGSQSYSVPSSIKSGAYSTIFVHCKRFNHTFGRAKLK